MSEKDGSKSKRLSNSPETLNIAKRSHRNRIIFNDKNLRFHDQETGKHQTVPNSPERNKLTSNDDESDSLKNTPTFDLNSSLKLDTKESFSNQIHTSNCQKLNNNNM